MKKLVYSALALTLVSVPAFAADNGWSGLDKEIESLSNSLAANNSSGPKIGGWVIVDFRYSKDDSQKVTDPSGLSSGKHTKADFQFETVRLEFSGDAGNDYSYKVSFDLAKGTAASNPSYGRAVLKDAYIDWKIVDQVKGRIGNFKEPFLRSGLISDNRLMFLQRTGLGALFAGRDIGVMLSGTFDVVNWYVSAQNGYDDQGKDQLYTGRITANVIGNGTGSVEGAYGAGDDTNLTVGLAYADETDLDKGGRTAVEASFTTGPFSVAAELVNFDKGTSVGGVNTYGSNDPVIGLNDNAKKTPWDATISYLVTDQWEAAFRYEDARDVDNSKDYGVAVNRYTQGHDIKWQGQWRHVKTDNAIGDSDEFALGLAVSF
jgi:hypothetical protein